MNLFKTPIEKRVAGKFKEVDKKIKTSFSLIRKDVEEMQVSIEEMKEHLKKREKSYDYAKREDNRLRAEFRKDVDEFTQKIKQLGLALEKVKEIEKEVVLKSNLAKIEDTIRNDFRQIIDEFKIKVKELDKRLNKTEKDRTGENRKRRWFFGKKSRIKDKVS